MMRHGLRSCPFNWAKSMTSRGLHPVVEANRQANGKGIRSEAAIEDIAARLERNPKTPKRDTLTQQARA